MPARPVKNKKKKGRRILIWEPFIPFWKPSKHNIDQFGNEHLARIAYGLLSRRIFVLLTVISVVFLGLLFVSKYYIIGLLLSSGLAIRTGYVHTQKPGSVIMQYYHFNLIVLLCHIFLFALAAYTIQNMLRGRY